jgi:hypothetical protein
VGLRADSFADLVRRVRAYTLDGVAHQIVAPTLILDPEHDQYLKGQPQRVAKALTGASTTLITLTESVACHGPTRRCDWLNATVSAWSGNGMREVAASSPLLRCM